MTDGPEEPTDGVETEIVVDQKLAPTEAKTEEIDLQLEMQRSYLDYAMSVIVGRALPDLVARNEERKGARGLHGAGNRDGKEQDPCVTRCRARWDGTAEAAVTWWRRLSQWWLPQMSFKPHVEPIRAVPGTNGRLLWFHMKGHSICADQHIISRMIPAMPLTRTMKPTRSDRPMRRWP